MVLYSIILFFIVHVTPTRHITSHTLGKSIWRWQVFIWKMSSDESSNDTVSTLDYLYGEINAYTVELEELYQQAIKVVELYCRPDTKFRTALGGVRIGGSSMSRSLFKRAEHIQKVFICWTVFREHIALTCTDNMDEGHILYNYIVRCVEAIDDPEMLSECEEILKDTLNSVSL